jgi:hypothetical protein
MNTAPASFFGSSNIFLSHFDFGSDHRRLLPLRLAAKGSSLRLLPDFLQRRSVVTVFRPGNR